jgi:hypothetical protein
MNTSIISPHQQVFFEGGLGSQLLSLVEYYAKLEIFDGKVIVNTDYFTKHTIHNRKITVRPWRLHHYGFSLDFFASSNRKVNPAGIIEASRPTIFEHAHFLIENRILDEFDATRITLPKEIQNSRVSELTSTDSDFGSIHLRRGDYRKVASHLVPLGDVLSLLVSESDVLPRSLFFFTDSFLRPRELIQLKKTFRDVEKNLVLVQGVSKLSDIEVHGIMRRSRFLISSNSTFSFSSALLRENRNAKIYIPRIFNKDEASIMNNVYNSIKDFNKY